MLKLKKFVFNPFQVNTYLLYAEDKEAMIIDPACSDPGEKLQLREFINEEQIKLKAIINTHCHVDHLLGVEFIRKEYDIEFLCAEEEQFLIDSSEAQADFFGLPLTKPSAPDRYISESDSLDIGGTAIKIFKIPGHSPGSLAFYIEEANMLFSGDVLFSGSIGRTDLPGGDYQELVKGIQSKILKLDDRIDVYPGHGPPTTIEREMLTNPFLQ